MVTDATKGSITFYTFPGRLASRFHPFVLTYRVITPISSDDAVNNIAGRAEQQNNGYQEKQEKRFFHIYAPYYIFCNNIISYTSFLFKLF
jgi:hypothetical protein